MTSASAWNSSLGWDKIAIHRAFSLAMRAGSIAGAVSLTATVEQASGLLTFGLSTRQA